MSKKSKSPRKDQNPMGEMTFVEHLVELRDRLLRVVLTILVFLLVLFPFANDLYHFLASPLLRHLPEGTSMIATQVASPFLTPFKLALFVSMFISMPVALYHLWAFVAPGPVQERATSGLPADAHQQRALLSGHGLRLLRGLSPDVRLLSDGRPPKGSRS